MKMPNMCPFEKKRKRSFFSTNIFFSRKKIFVQGTTFVQFFMYCKAKKFQSDPKMFEIFFSKIVK